MKNFEKYMKNVDEGFQNKRSSDEQKIIDVWEKHGMEITIGRGWKFKGTPMRSERDAVRFALQAIGATSAEKIKNKLGGWTYKTPTVSFMTSKSSVGHIRFTSWIPQSGDIKESLDEVNIQLSKSFKWSEILKALHLGGVLDTKVINKIGTALMGPKNPGKRKFDG